MIERLLNLKYRLSFVIKEMEGFLEICKVAGFKSRIDVFGDSLNKKCEIFFSDQEVKGSAGVEA